jgi:CubicO group peptidase (beta-lactamase class C family)
MDQHFDTLAVSVIDFKSQKFECFEISNYEEVSKNPFLYFDLASITKTLTNAVIHLKNPEIFSPEMKLLLNHQAGLPMGGRLSKYDWREFLWNYQINPSETLYSDYSSLRCMLEIEKKTGKKLKELCSDYFDEKLLYWLDLKIGMQSPITGWRDHKLISGAVHDDNCFVISEFISHAGLFATIDGLSRSLINLNQRENMIEKVNEMYKTQNVEDRFIGGFDRVQDLSLTSAGTGCSLKTFGHLGFTGTSYWIDIEKMRAAVILTNGTRSYWYDKAGLIDLRKKIGTLIWQM